MPSFAENPWKELEKKASLHMAMLMAVKADCSTRTPMHIIQQPLLRGDTFSVIAMLARCAFVRQARRLADASGPHCE